MRWLKTGLMMMILGACSSPQAHASPTEQEQWAKPIKQDANLYHVDTCCIAVNNWWQMMWQQ